VDAVVNGRTCRYVGIVFGFKKTPFSDRPTQTTVRLGRLAAGQDRLEFLTSIPGGLAHGEVAAGKSTPRACSPPR